MTLPLYVGPALAPRRVAVIKRRASEYEYKPVTSSIPPFQNGNEESAKTGELLVETEPIRYELSAVKLNWAKKRDLKRSPRVLVTASIANERSQAANMAEACAYSYKYSIYWGRKHAILNGMSTTIKLANGTSLSNVTWGMRHEENRTDAYK